MLTENGIYYLYRHIRLDTNQPFYIGIAGKLADRGEFYYRANRVSNRNHIWNNVYNKCNKSIRVEVLFESDNWEFIKEKEKELIALYGRLDLRTGILANMTDGGDGTIGAVYTEDRRKKHSNSMRNSVHSLKGKKLPDWWKDKIRKTKIGDKNHMFGKASSRAKIVVDLSTGVFYNSIMEAAKSTPYQFQYISAMLNGAKPNKTNLIFA